MLLPVALGPFGMERGTLQLKQVFFTAVRAEIVYFPAGMHEHLARAFFQVLSTEGAAGHLPSSPSLSTTSSATPSTALLPCRAGTFRTFGRASTAAAPPTQTLSFNFRFQQH